MAANGTASSAITTSGLSTPFGLGAVMRRRFVPRPKRSTTASPIAENGNHTSTKTAVASDSHFSISVPQPEAGESHSRMPTLRTLLTSCLSFEGLHRRIKGKRHHQVGPTSEQTDPNSVPGINVGTGSANWGAGSSTFKQTSVELPTFPLSQREMFTVVRTWKSVQKEIVDTGMRMFLRYEQQGHHHNGDQAARRPHMMCSICGRRFGCNFKGGLAHSIARPRVPISSPLTHMIYLSPFLSYLVGSKAFPLARPSARPTWIRWQTPL